MVIFGSVTDPCFEAITQRGGGETANFLSDSLVACSSTLTLVEHNTHNRHTQHNTERKREKQNENKVRFLR